MKEIRCQLCGYKWKPRTKNRLPKSCPKCKRYDYLEGDLTIEEKLEECLLAIMKLLTAKDVAEILGVPLQRVYELTRQGILPVVLLGQRQVRFDEQVLKDWIAAGGNKGGK